MVPSVVSELLRGMVTFAVGLMARTQAERRLAADSVVYRLAMGVTLTRFRLENSDVLPDGSVAVAVTISPAEVAASKVTSKLTFPSRRS